MPGFFSVVIPRNSVVPISRSEVYFTSVDNQTMVQVEVFQGENIRAEENVPLGEFMVENLPAQPAGTVQVEIHFDFDINGILTVTATEKGKGNQGSLVVNNSSVQRLSSHELTAARAEMDTLFSGFSGGFGLGDRLEDDTIDVDSSNDSSVVISPEILALQTTAQSILNDLEDEDDKQELVDLMEQLHDAIADGDPDEINQFQESLEDLLYYLTNNAEAES
jgi:molecular chaperone DnaK